MPRRRSRPVTRELARGRARLDSGPPDLEAHTLALSGEELVLFSFALPRRELPQRVRGRLSVSQQDVALGILSGETNAEIARRRGASVHTVANQVAQIFRALGVSSRRELARLCARPGRPRTKAP